MSDPDTVCSKCNKTFKTKAGRNAHLNYKHRKARTYECYICRKRYPYASGRWDCQNRHTKSFGCPVKSCHFRCPKKRDAKIHMRRRHLATPRFEPHELPPMPPGLRRRTRTKKGSQYSVISLSFGPLPNFDATAPSTIIQPSPINVPDHWTAQYAFGASELPFGDFYTASAPNAANHYQPHFYQSAPFALDDGTLTTTLGSAEETTSIASFSMPEGAYYYFYM